MPTPSLVSTTLFRLRKLSRRMWVRTTAFALLALVAALFSRLVAPVLPTSLARAVDVDAVLDILAVLSSSMLAVTGALCRRNHTVVSTGGRRTKIAGNIAAAIWKAPERS